MRSSVAKMASPKTMLSDMDGRMEVTVTSSPFNGL